MPDISVCIVNMNNRDLLEQCLESICRTTRQASTEIFVVDNCSSDGSAEMIQARYPEVRLIRNDRILGYSASQNRALQRCSSRYILVFNEDMLVLPGALDHMVAFMDAHPDAGMLGCRLLNPDGSLQPSCWPFPNLKSRFLRALYLDGLAPAGRLSGVFYLGSWAYDSVREVDVIQGCCMLLRRELLQQVGLMDEEFFLYFEETDWCYRAKQRGWKVYFTPDAEIVHYGGQSTGRQPARMGVIYLQSLLKYFRKHHGRVAASAVWSLSAIETALRLIYWRIRWLLQGPKREHAAYKISLYSPALHWLMTRQSQEAG